jgi:hypothetical protein
VFYLTLSFDYSGWSNRNGTDIMRIKLAAQRAALILTIVGSGAFALGASDHASAASDPQPDPVTIMVSAKAPPMAAFGIRWS